MDILSLSSSLAFPKRQKPFLAGLLNNWLASLRLFSVAVIKCQSKLAYMAESFLWPCVQACRHHDRVHWRILQNKESRERRVRIRVSQGHRSPSGACPDGLFLLSPTLRNVHRLSITPQACTQASTARSQPSQPGHAFVNQWCINQCGSNLHSYWHNSYNLQVEREGPLYRLCVGFQCAQNWGDIARIKE